MDDQKRELTHLAFHAASIINVEPDEARRAELGEHFREKFFELLLKGNPPRKLRPVRRLFSVKV